MSWEIELFDVVVNSISRCWKWHKHHLLI